MGVVPYEMPTSWHQQALRAQAVAARTYGAFLRAQNRSRYYQICDTTSCQVYGGIAAEQPSSNSAGDGDRGQDLDLQGQARLHPVLVVVRRLDVGRRPAVPRRQARPVRRSRRQRHALVDDPGQRWLARGRAPGDRVTGRHAGDASARATARGAAGCCRSGSNGTKGIAYMTGEDFRWKYGLRSNWFTIEPTPIIERWRELGAAKSLIGRPESRRVQGRRRGRRRTSTADGSTGARASARSSCEGAIKAKYNALGGPTSIARLADLRRSANPSQVGSKVRFQKGRIYYVHAGRRGVRGHRRRSCGTGRRRAPTASKFGFPTSDVKKIPGGQRGTFEHGTITWKRSTNTFTVTMD